MKNIGCIYLAFGSAHLGMTLLSLASLKVTNPDLPVHIITNQNFNFSRLSFWDSATNTVTIINEKDKSNRNIKTTIYLYSPFDKTIFLDSDTVILKSLDSADYILQRYDIALKINSHIQKNEIKFDNRIKEHKVYMNLPSWNSGVILFRKGDVAKNFFKQWNAYYHEMELPTDQTSLVKVVMNTKCGFFSLDDRWNSAGPSFCRRKWFENSLILHYTTLITKDSRRLLSLTADLLVKNGIDDAAFKAEIIRRISSRKRSMGKIKFIVWSIYCMISRSCDCLQSIEKEISLLLKSS